MLLQPVCRRKNATVHLWGNPHAVRFAPLSARSLCGWANLRQYLPMKPRLPDDPGDESRASVHFTALQIKQLRAFAPH